MLIHFYLYEQLFRKQANRKWAHFLQPLMYFYNYRTVHKYVTMDFFFFSCKSLETWLLPHREAQFLQDLATKFSCGNPKDNEHTPLMHCVKDANLYPGDKRILIYYLQLMHSLWLVIASGVKVVEEKGANSCIILNSCLRKVFVYVPILNYTYALCTCMNCYRTWEIKTSNRPHIFKLLEMCLKSQA